jgi:glycine cleavage system H protein
MRFPEDLKYTKDHEWAKVDGNTITIGITDHAQSALGDVVYIELPPLGRVLKKGDTFGVVESIKAVSDLYSPVTGRVVASNTPLIDDPSQINKDPQGIAWMVKIELTDLASTKDLLDAKTYSKLGETLK